MQLETLFLTNLLEISVGRDFGALEGLKPAVSSRITDTR